METDKVLERILEQSVTFKVPATVLTLEYLNNRYIGLSRETSLQFLDIKYKNNINLNRDYKK